MLQNLLDTFVDGGLVGGMTSNVGWGALVRNQILPLLDHPKLRHHESILREGFSRAAAPISVFVVGEGKFGKSTLVNALLGTGVEVAKSDFLPLTWHITRYVPESSEKRFEIHYDTSDGSSSRLESTAATSGRFGDFGDGIIKFGSLAELEFVMENEEAARRKTEASSSVWQVVQTVQSSEQGIAKLELVDSPGISQIRTGTASGESIEDFYHRADVVLWLLAADKTNSSETRRSIEAMSRYGKPIIGVVNRADLIPASQRPAVLNDVKSRFDGLLQEVVLVSAKNGFLATVDRNHEKLHESGMPELRAAISKLAGKNGKRTKALSLYNTSKQAAVESAKILKGEADVLKRNLNLFGKNLDSSIGYIKRGKKCAKQTLRAESGNVAAAIAATMRRTFVTHGEDDVPLFDENAVNKTLRQQKSALIQAVNQALGEELQNVQDEIAVREYQVQSYRGDATVKSHESRTSIKMTLAEIPHELQEYSFDQKLDWASRIVEFFGDLADAFWQMLGHQPTQQEIRERQKKRRTRALDEFISGAMSIEDQLHKHIKSGIENSVNEVSLILGEEVEACFDREFDSSDSVKNKIGEHRRQANLSVVPPAVTYSSYAMLCKAKNFTALEVRTTLANRSRKTRSKLRENRRSKREGLKQDPPIKTSTIEKGQQTVATPNQQRKDRRYDSGHSLSGMHQPKETRGAKVTSIDPIDEVLGLDDLQRKYGYSKGTEIFNLINKD